ncbi:unnamed protein product [Mycetohabitans rhizoxinica HKI 454]|uniref:Uncharacterized protein n=2 Tax=Mycetohabitans rhizoxinica TaxID=412963 RepID=E5AN69_MYCRK|nr:unnamed protein product [Mycetohabitans rhizoxinica HKI 454]
MLSHRCDGSVAIGLCYAFISGFCRMRIADTMPVGRANIKMGEIMKVGSIVRSSHIAVPCDARGIVLRILGDMAMVTWFEGEPGQSKQLNTEPFFLADLIETGEVVRPADAPLH